MTVCVLTLIDDDITIFERIDDNIYDYLIKIVSEFKESDLTVYLVLIEDQKAVYIKLYSS